MSIMVKIGNSITKMNKKIASFASMLIYPLILVVVIEVVFRYAFNKPTTFSYDLTWMLYAALVFLGGAFCLHDEIHVRADIFYNMLKRRGKAIINMFCYPFFFFSSILGLSISTFDLMVKAWIHNEKSPYTSWNPPVWPIKAILFISMAILLLQGIVKFSAYVKDLKRGGDEK